MHLYLSGTSPTNSIYTNSEGQALYKVRTPSRILGRTTTICRIVGGIPVRDIQDLSMRDRYAHIANIDWKLFRSSKMRFRGREVRTRSFFKKQGWGWHGRSRLFFGPDGCEYKWRLNAKTSELSLTDGSNTRVARFHPGWSGASYEHGGGCLEIFPPGEHIMDTILVTDLNF